MKQLLQILMLQSILVSSTLAVAEESDTHSFKYCDRFLTTNDPRKIFVRDIAQELGRRLNVKVENFNAPIKRCLQMLKTGEVDFILYSHITDERSEYVDFIIPSNGADVVFLVRKSEGDWLRSYSDFNNKTLGMVDGYDYISTLDTATDINKQFVVDATKLPKMLLSGRVDAFLSNQGRARNILLDYPSIVKATYRESHFQRHFIGISKESPLYNQRDQVKHTIVGMIDDGYVDTILEQQLPGFISPFPKSPNLN